MDRRLLCKYLLWRPKTDFSLLKSDRSIFLKISRFFHFRAFFDFSKSPCIFLRTLKKIDFSEEINRITNFAQSMMIFSWMCRRLIDVKLSSMM